MNHDHVLYLVVFNTLQEITNLQTDNYKWICMWQ